MGTTIGMLGVTKVFNAQWIIEYLRLKGRLILNLTEFSRPLNPFFKLFCSSSLFFDLPSCAPFAKSNPHSPTQPSKGIHSNSYHSTHGNSPISPPSTLSCSLFPEYGWLRLYQPPPHQRTTLNCLNLRKTRKYLPKSISQMRKNINEILLKQISNYLPFKRKWYATTSPQLAAWENLELILLLSLYRLL